MASLSLTHLGACERVPSDLGVRHVFFRELKSIHTISFSICLLLLLCCDWSDHGHMTTLQKMILGCNITFQPSDSELSGSCAQFSI